MARRIVAMIPWLLGVAPLVRAAPLATTAPTLATTAANDPLEWQPPAALPPIRPRMEGARFAAALADADRHLDMSILQLPDPPLELTERVKMDTSWYPTRAFAAGGKRSAKWDELMLVATRVCDDNPDLAETALLHAQQAGYDGWLLPAVAARIALAELRFDDAMAFGSAALEQAPADRRPIVAAWVYTAAVLNDHLEVAANLSQQFPLVQDPDELPLLLKQIAAVRAAHPDAKAPSPAALAAGIVPAGKPPATFPANALRPVDVTGQVRLVHVDGDDSVSGEAVPLRSGGALKLGAPSGRYDLDGFGPSLPDCLLTVHFKYRLADHKQTPWAHSVSAELVDQRKPDAPLVKINLLDGGTVAVDSIAADDVRIQLSPQLRWKADGATLRLIVLHQRCEVLLNGQRVFLGAFEPDVQRQKIIFALQAVGVHASFTQLRWIRLAPPEGG